MDELHQPNFVTSLIRKTKSGDELVGSSAAISEVAAHIARYAAVDAAAAIVGETGVGKNLVAELIHENSARRAGPFVKVDCSTIPKDLWESECMGSVRGSFTGATNRMGLFKTAQGGTLFIDELQDLTWAHQGKIRDFIGAKLIRAVGAAHAEFLDVRILLGMNRNPQQMVREGRFRADLFRRMSQNVVRIPPLRERQEDIPDLARYILQRTCQQQGMGPKELLPEAMALLQQHDWSWNVGELENVLENAVLCSQDGLIRGEHIQESLTAWVEPEPAAKPADRTEYIAKVKELGLCGVVEDFERDLILMFLKMHDGRLRPAARAMNVAPSTLESKLEKLGLRKREIRMRNADGGTRVEESSEAPRAD
jgi:DNA-binding NtrC family response regulator